MEERNNLLMHAPMPVALLRGPEHVYELANAPYIRMVGGRAILGKPYVQASPELAGAALLDALDVVYATGRSSVVQECSVRFDRRGDGTLEERFCNFTLEPLRNGTGEVYGLLAVALDVTEQVNARRTEGELRQLVRELESANRAKDEFLATLSHELRTPLNAIVGWVRLLRSGTLGADKVERALDAIERNSLAQLRLNDDLLDVSRIISGKLRLDLQPLELLPVVERAIESMVPALEMKSIHFLHAVDPSAGAVEGDAHRLQQVIWNLLSNAVKFTPKGGTVRLLVERVDSNVELSVSDTGQGIPKLLLPKIFERFKQADGSASRVHGGLGLGLAITRHIVELHNGTIEVQSEGEGRGTVVTVRLPARAFESEARGPFRQSSSSDLKPQFERPKELQGLTVLVVEDETDTRELLAEVLHQLGASALVAKGAEEGLAMLDRASPQVLVSDIGMPGMDGYDFIRAVRARAPERGGRVVALALTAFAGREDHLRALRAGFQMHLSKPVDPAQFVAALAHLARLALPRP